MKGTIRSRLKEVACCSYKRFCRALIDLNTSRRATKEHRCVSHTVTSRLIRELQVLTTPKAKYSKLSKNHISELHPEISRWSLEFDGTRELHWNFVSVLRLALAYTWTLITSPDSCLHHRRRSHQSDLSEYCASRSRVRRTSRDREGGKGGGRFNYEIPRCTAKPRMMTMTMTTTKCRSLSRLLPRRVFSLVDVSGANAHWKIPQIFTRRSNTRARARAHELPVMD